MKIYLNDLSNDLSETRFFENRNLNLRGDKIIYIKVKTTLKLSQILTDMEIFRFTNLMFVEILFFFLIYVYYSILC